MHCSQGGKALLSMQRASQEQWEADVSVGAIKAYLVTPASQPRAASWFPGQPEWQVGLRVLYVGRHACCTPQLAVALLIC